MQNGRKLAVAALVVVSVAPLWAIGFAAWSDVNGGGTGPDMSYEYEMGTLSLRAMAVAAGLGLVLAAASAAIWVSRDRRVLAAALVTATAAGWLTAGAAATERDRGISTPADVRATAPGSTRAELEHRLGRAGGTGTAMRDGREHSCLAYATEDRSADLYCFDGDRLAFAVDR
jgi:hypothetical protein